MLIATASVQAREYHIGSGTKATKLGSGNLANRQCITSIKGDQITRFLGEFLAKLYQNCGFSGPYTF